MFCHVVPKFYYIQYILSPQLMHMGILAVKIQDSGNKYVGSLLLYYMSLVIEKWPL